MPRLARAEGRDPRLLVIVLRGALDGLAAVAPVGDPDWSQLRGDKALMLDGQTPALPLDGFFALNPAMPNLHRLYQAGQAIDRACGGDALSRALAFRRPGRAGKRARRARARSIPAGSIARSPRSSRASRADHARRQALAVGPITPLVMRGPAPVLSWVPPRLPPASDETMMRLLDLYRHTDPALRARARGAHRPRRDRARRRHGTDAGRTTGPVVQAGGIAQVRAYFAEAAGAAAKFLAAPTARASARSPSTAGTPTSTRARSSGRLADLLGALDGAIAAIETNMGAAWRDTVVVLVTEFGRTAHINGNDGTDHGTATVALLAGGAVKGGRVIADWPGLKDADLYESRDLKPTTDLRAVLKGVLQGPPARR